MSPDHKAGVLERNGEVSTGDSPSRRTAVIIGAGPAGLTAAYELLTRTDIIPLVLEKSDAMGGISRTVRYKGNRIDIGGHRFFSKSDRVMDWWLKHMPPEANANGPQTITYHHMSREIDPSRAPAVTSADRVMLTRKRKSRIYFLRKFFDYPISLTKDTLMKLGVVRVLRVGMSYMRSVLFPTKNVTNLEQFLQNRFGRELYNTFFKSYTEKVWGVPCQEISAEWGEQRIKGLSIRKTITHFLMQRFRRKTSIAQKGVETSLIEQFLYPKYGPGQMWESVAEDVVRMGGRIVTNCDVVGISCRGDRVHSVSAIDQSGGRQEYKGDYFFSTMPMKELIRSMDANIPDDIRHISEGLLYRDFITVGLLVKKLKVHEKTNSLVEDNWIYIQEPDVLAGRLQIFNNWSPYMVANPDQVWLGVEYFCYEDDHLWKKPDAEMSAFAGVELDKIGILDKNDILDSVVIRMPKTYPAYFGTYNRFDQLRAFVDRFENLFLIGRNGMHRYNNQDHSMLTAMLAVDNIIEGRTEKSNLWEVNTEEEYHETATSKKPAALAHAAGK
jgi:protoporphyrinogen oxidase